MQKRKLKAKTNKGRRRNDAHKADQAVKISPWQELLERKITQTKKQNRNFSYTPKVAQMRLPLAESLTSSYELHRVQVLQLIVYVI